MDEVFVELGLLWIEDVLRELVHGTGRVPEWMALELMPAYSASWIFLKQTFDEIVEVIRKVGDCGSFRLEYHLNELLQ